jgi:hypothetical protein
MTPAQDSSHTLRNLYNPEFPNKFFPLGHIYASLRTEGLGGNTDPPYTSKMPSSPLPTAKF